MYLRAERFGQLGLLDLPGDADAPLAHDVRRLQRQVGGRIEGLTADGADPLQGQYRQIEAGAQLAQPQDVVVLQGLLDPRVVQALQLAADLYRLRVGVRLHGIVQQQVVVPHGSAQGPGELDVSLYAAVGMILAALEPFGL